METINYEAVGKRLKELRMNAGITQTELARNLHQSHNGVISWIEAGRKVPSLDVLVAYSERFGVTTDWILKGTATGEQDQNIQDEIEGLVEQDAELLLAQCEKVVESFGILYPTPVN